MTKSFKVGEFCEFRKTEENNGMAYWQKWVQSYGEWKNVAVVRLSANARQSTIRAACNAAQEV